MVLSAIEGKTQMNSYKYWTVNKFLLFLIIFICISYFLFFYFSFSVRLIWLNKTMLY